MRSSAKTGGRALRGLTLVELLAVIATLAVLATVAGSVVTKGIVSARQHKCANNLRQIGAAIHLYAAENDGALPGTTHEHGADFKEAWIFTLAPYLDHMDTVRICPADPRGADRLASSGTSYILNSYVFVPKVGPFGEALPGSMNNLRRIPEPSRTLFAANISDDQGVSAQSDHTHSERWGGSTPGGDAFGSWDHLCADIQPDRFSSAPNEDHTSGSANYLFADGHVENLLAKDVKERLQRGDNIAMPPGI